MSKIFILGGYGNFGSRIARLLAKSAVPIVICGRDQEKLIQLKNKLKAEFPSSDIDFACFDVDQNLSEQLKKHQPLVVINTCGPFQDANYKPAQDCIKAKVHYIDLSDGRDFVKNISALDDEAKKNNVLVVSGASTVPALSSAVLEKYKFAEIDSLKFGIAPGQKAQRGLATTKAILGYIGRKTKPFKGKPDGVYGWQDSYLQEYPKIGKRWMANCDIPDLDLLPEHYPIQSIQFSAGMENPIVHFGTWALSWLVRIFPIIQPKKYANFLLKISNLFNFFGSDDGGMHIIIEGKDAQGNYKKLKWFIIAKNGFGPYIPTIPSVILAKKLYHNQITKRGAMPCVAMVLLDEYLKELEEFGVETFVFD